MLLFEPHSYCAALNSHVTRNRFTLHKAEIFPATYFLQNVPTEPSRLQVILSWPLVAPQSLFPRVHLSFTGVGFSQWWRRVAGIL